MSECAAVDRLVTPYLDGELQAGDCQVIERHLGACPPCRSRVGAERVARDLVRAQQPRLCRAAAPAALRARCTALARGGRVAPGRSATRSSAPWRWARPWLVATQGTGRPLVARLGPLVVAASLIVLVGGAFVYRVTASSTRVVAAELTADHVKCFAMNAVLRTHQSPGAVESSLAAGFNWDVHLPEDAADEGLELVGARPCLYGEGKVAHVMYRHHGKPVSLFMLPRTTRADQLVRVFGHEAVVWSADDRTFVLISRESHSEVARMAAFVRAALQ